LCEQRVRLQPDPLPAKDAGGDIAELTSALTDDQRLLRMTKETTEGTPALPAALVESKGRKNHRNRRNLI